MRLTKHVVASPSFRPDGTYGHVFQLPQDEAAQAAEQGLQRELVRNAILRNIFQLLIVGSGIDWSADEGLQRRLLSLGEANKE